MKLRILTGLATTAVVALVLGGCTSQEETTSTEDPIASSPPTSARRDICIEDRRYIAVVSDASCKAVTTEHGEWTPSPLFDDADAPAEAASTCVYNWTPNASSPDAAPEKDALYIYVQPYTTGGLTPACGDSTSVRDTVAVDSIPYLDIFTHAGANGCDVCGILKRGKIWVVLPPEKVFSRQFAVELTNGTTKYYQINADEKARAVTIDLPELPAGIEYVEGRVGMY